jgi:hypothetical protein
MKFLRMMNYRIMNEMETDGDAGSESAALDDSAFEDSELIESGFESSFKEFGLDASKYGFGEKNAEDAPKEESHGSEETQEAGQVTDEKSYLEWVNSLGAIHNDSPVKVESIDEVKNALQMFKDYTSKTQNLSEERKGWEAEKSNAEREVNLAIQEFNTQRAEYDKQLQELNQWTFTLNNLQETAPDLFEEVQRAYSGTVKQFSNPVLDQQLAAIRAELAETKKGLAVKEDKLVLDSFESDMNSLASTEQALKELGVTIDREAVRKQWAATGLDVKSVVGSLYFESVAKAQASRSKVESTKQKVAARPTGGAGASRPGSKVAAISPKLSHFDYAKELLNRYK